MSNIVIYNSTLAASGDFSLRPDIEDANGLKFRIYDANGIDGKYILAPYENIDFLIVPSGVIAGAITASGLLDGSKLNNDTLGIYYSRYSNGDGDTSPEFNIHVSNKALFENTKFYLYWHQYRDADSYSYYGSNANGVYSYPHKITQDELLLTSSTSNLLGSGMLSVAVQYRNIVNDNSVDYGSNKPYMIGIRTGDKPDSAGVDGWIPASGFDAGSAESGIIVNLPYYTSSNTPAVYWMTVANEWAGWEINTAMQNNSTFHTYYDYKLNISVKHLEELTLNFGKSSNNYYDADLKKVENDEQEITPYIINRRRASIGIKDISLVENTFTKKVGTYISNAYVLDFLAYTFTLKVSEFLPDYKSYNKYDTVKYYVQFNNQEWIRVSPISRPDEYDKNNKLIPKMFVFDQDVNKSNTFNNIQFLELSTPVNLFSIKIEFDFTSVVDEDFVPAEVRDYKAVIFDRNQLLIESAI
jgi:hypothetical protein